jgi:hypothetical protein
MIARISRIFLLSGKKEVIIPAEILLVSIFVARLSPITFGMQGHSQVYVKAVHFRHGFSIPEMS